MKAREGASPRIVQLDRPRDIKRSVPGWHHSLDDKGLERTHPPATARKQNLELCKSQVHVSYFANGPYYPTTSGGLERRRIRRLTTDLKEHMHGLGLVGTP